MSKVVLISGATGKQGGAVVDALLASPQAKDFTILALTRNPEGGSAQKLKSRGCKIVKGDLEDVPAIFEEAKKVVSEPIWGVFSVQVSLRPRIPEGPSDSLRWKELGLVGAN
jgi:nucleoside-diphosphate-sugar epimerase